VRKNEGWIEGREHEGQFAGPDPSTSLREILSGVRGCSTVDEDFHQFRRARSTKKFLVTFS